MIPIIASLIVWLILYILFGWVGVIYTAGAGLLIIFIVSVAHKMGWEL